MTRYCDTMPHGGRRFINRAGEPEDEAWAKEFEAKSRAGLLEDASASPEESNELRYVLEQIDFDLLRKIFVTIAQRCGIAKERVNFIEKNDIVATTLGVKSIPHRTGYYVEENTILFNVPDCVQLAADFGVEERICILIALCHEEVHAVDETSCYGTKEYHGAFKRNEAEMMVIKNGWTYSFKENRQIANPSTAVDSELIEELFYLFNEGRVQKLALEVVEQYVESDKGFVDKELRQKFIDQIQIARARIYYVKEVGFVDALIERISEHTGLSPQVVWQGIVKSGFSGENIYDTELRQAFDEMLYPGFLDKLAKVKTGKEMGAVLNKIE